MNPLLQWLSTRIVSRDRGAVGMLVVGIIIGVLLVIFGIIKFLIPGE